jgi:IclR family transcriptional regulator, pca regulon regulatory protein
MFGVRRAPSAVPHRGQAVAAINIAVPTTRWTVQSVEDKLAQHVQVAATKAIFSRYAG